MAMFDEIGGLLTSDDNLGHLSRLVNSDDRRTKTATAAAIPVLLGGLQKRSLTPASAKALFDMVSGDDGSALDDLGGFFGADDKDGLGSALVGAILGRQRQEVEATLAVSSGLSLEKIAVLLPKLAPAVAAFLGRKQVADGLDLDGLSGALATERHILEEVGFGEWLGLLDGGDPVDDEKGFQSGLAKIAGLGGLGLLARRARGTSDAPATATSTAALLSSSAPPKNDNVASDAAVIGSGAPTTAAATAATTASRSYEPAAGAPVVAREPQRGPGWLKWLIPLALAGLLVFLLYSCLADDDSTTATTTDESAQATPTGDDTAPAEATVDTAAETAAADTEATADAGATTAADPEATAAEATETPPVEGAEATGRVPGEYVPGRLLATAHNAGLFGTMLDAIERAGLVDTLEGDGPFTLLAPIDPAFELLPEELRNRILDDPELLAEVLSYHVIAGNVTTIATTTGEVDALDGSALYFDTSAFQAKVNGATILDADLATDNGFLQVIDRVLIPPRLVGATGLTVNDALSLEPVLFELGSAQLSPEGIAVLDGTVAYLNAIGASIEIGGHTDDDGEEATNLVLSQERADAVLAYLVDAGIPAERFTAVGYGETQPVQPNDTPTGKAANRRIEFTIVG